MPKKETQSHRFVILEFMRMFACLCLSVIHCLCIMCVYACLLVCFMCMCGWVGMYMHAFVFVSNITSKTD